MKVIVGLGNPGDQYKNTRHNLGFIVLDYLIQELNITSPFLSKHKSLFIKTVIDNEEVIFCKPQTFMNSSGDSLWEIRQFYKLKTEDFLIIYDELNINIGFFKFSFLRSDGGHNGVKNIIEAFNSNAFLKLRIGIGRLGEKNIRDFVLERFKPEEIEKIKGSFPMILEATKAFLKGISSDKLMNFYN